jgi:hypothetical protein
MWSVCISFKSSWVGTNLNTVMEKVELVSSVIKCPLNPFSVSFHGYHQYMLYFLGIKTCLWKGSQDFHQDVYICLELAWDTMPRSSLPTG